MSTVPKTFSINAPLWVALLITSLVHFLLILWLEIDSPDDLKANHKSVIITLINPPPRPVAKKTAVAAPPPPVPAQIKPAVAIKTPAQHRNQSQDLAKPVIKPPKRIKSHRLVMPTVVAVAAVESVPIPEPKAPIVTEPIVEPEIKVAPIVPAPIPKVEPEVKLEPAVAAPIPTKVEPEVKFEPAVAPIPEVEPEARIEPEVKVEPETKVEPAPEVVPDTAPVPQPISVPKVELNPIVAKPAETDKVVVQPEPVAQNIIAEPAKPAKKQKKKSGKTSSKSTAQIAEPTVDNTQPPLSLDDLAAQIAQVGEKYGNQPEMTGESQVKKSSSKSKHKFLTQQYIADCRHKAKRIGNLNYPKSAWGQEFTARSVIDAVIDSNGNIHSIRLKKSSGDSAIDQAAKNIVQMTSPCPEFPAALAEERDVINISFPLRFSDESGVTTQ